MMAEPCVLKMLEGMKELLQRASAAEEKEQLQRSLDRMRVEQDLRRIAWEKDYDAAVQLIREMRACLESVRNSLDRGEALRCGGLSGESRLVPPINKREKNESVTA